MQNQLTTQRHALAQLTHINDTHCNHNTMLQIWFCQK